MNAGSRASDGGNLNTRDDLEQTQPLLVREGYL